MTRANMATMCDVVGVYEISQLLGVEQQTVAQWKFRGLMPEPCGTVSKLPAWERAAIVAWAKETDRWPPKPR